MLKVTAMGYLGRDAELKTYNNSTFLSFSIGVNTGKDKPVIWISCSSNNVKLGQWLKKGSRVMVGGTMSFKPYMDKSGVLNAGASMYCDYIEFVSSNKPVVGSSNGSSLASVAEGYSVSSLEEEDMPF
jgi:single-stranded DNA-binding protein